ncbi:MAG: metal-dependent hydrolase [Pseudomonadota bacterium]
MFVLGHLGIGKWLAARPYRRFSRADKRAFFVGALLPDLIDKPLYYGWSWLSGKHGADAGIISGTHLFGHTGLFLLTVAAAALVTRAHAVRALAIGVATHLALDFVGLSMDTRTLLWPLRGWRFPSYPFGSLTQHLGTMFRPVTFAGEVVGAAILWWDYRAARSGAPSPD